MTEPLRWRVLLEVPVASVEDALAAQEGGADRLELNAALPLGGLTPSLGTLIEVKAAGALPAFAMIRPRPGGFACGRADFPVLQRDADLALRHGADGKIRPGRRSWCARGRGLTGGPA
jgi:copper homeostasis protein